MSVLLLFKHFIFCILEDKSSCSCHVDCHHITFSPSSILPTWHSPAVRLYLFVVQGVVLLPNPQVDSCKSCKSRGCGGEAGLRLEAPSVSERHMTTLLEASPNVSFIFLSALYAPVNSSYVNI